MRRRALARAGLVCAIVVALDQITKHTLGTWIERGQVRHLVPGITFVHVRNTGVAFSFLAGSGAVVDIISALVVVGLIAFLVARPGRRLLWLPIGMLVGGAIGNGFGRAANGSVIDFIKLPHWPAFNVADISITFGAIILALVIERGTRRDVHA